MAYHCLLCLPSSAGINTMFSGLGSSLLRLSFQYHFSCSILLLKAARTKSPNEMGSGNKSSAGSAVL